MVNALVVLAGLPFALGGGVLLWYGGRLAVGLFRRSRQTRTVDADIVEVSATETATDHYEPTVRYRYEFDGRTYESTQVREGQDPPSGSQRVVDSFLDSYEEGDTVTATLLSSTPEQAVLEPSTDSWPYVVAGVSSLLGTVFFLLGTGITLSGIFS